MPTFTISPDGLLITADGCSAFPDGSPTGHFALIRRGACSFHTQATNGQDAGATGVVLYNDLSGFVSPTSAGPVEITIPLVRSSPSPARNRAADRQSLRDGVTTWPDR